MAPAYRHQGRKAHRGDIVVQNPEDALYLLGDRPRPIAGSDAPRCHLILELKRIYLGVSLLNERRAPGIFEVVHIVLAHE